jgi:hypothetical protein
MSVPSKEDQREKEGGEIFTTLHDWNLPGKMGMLQKGGRFVECNDGWFWVYAATGERMHFRVNKTVINSVLRKEKDDVAV